MTRKPKGFLDVESSTNDRAKLPTLNQYLKETTDAEIKLDHEVLLIWFPGRWKNYTLQTADFRVSITERNELYEALRAGLDEFTRGHKGMRISLVDRKRGTFKLSQSETNGDWFFIGDYGIRFEPTEL